ncbi:hypothetical protein [Aeoliella sp.]|uniref:hypothetical protein n=1 Tax=Aeoliella sp. TaxID=2795800 RepID=UPI003CCC0593
MKGKGKGLAAIKDLALKHGEKLVMLLVVLAAVWLVKATISHESLPDKHQPRLLKSSADNVDQALQQYTWEDAAKEELAKESIREFKPVKSASLEVPSDPYTLSAMDRPVVPPSMLRTDPKVLPVADFEVHAVTGLIALIDPERVKELALKYAREDEERRLEQEREAERRAREGEDGARGRGRGRGGFDMGFENGGLMGENENRRPVAVSLPRAGVELSGEERIRRASCAVVMAKVPLPEQLQEYKAALESAKGYDPSLDFPQYLGYMVERAIVTEGSDKLDWKRLNFPNGHYRVEGDNRRTLPAITNAPGLEFIDKMTYNWPQGMEELHDPRYDDPSLTVPLAPLVGRNWDEMAYMSEVPLASEMEEMLEEGFTEEGSDAPPEEEAGDGLDFTDAVGRPGRGGGVMDGEFGRGGRRPGGRGGMGPGMRGGMRPRSPMGRGGEGEFGGGMRGGMRGGMGGGGATRVDENGNLVVDVPFLMLRFFDLTVQPGKRYKYRVKLILQDPNYKKPTTILDAEVIARDRSRPDVTSDWSEPSPTVVVPQAGIIRVAESNQPRGGAYSEPTATMLVESFGLDERQNAMQVYKELETVTRGSVMNYQGKVEMLVEQGRFIEAVDDFTIDTGVMVLDLAGGRTNDGFTRDKPEPTHALMMDSSGRMYLRDELDDEMEVAIHRAVFAETEPGTGGGFFPGGGREGRGGGRGGDRGGGFEF